jgi:hypothetical protein
MRSRSSWNRRRLAFTLRYAPRREGTIGSSGERGRRQHGGTGALECTSGHEHRERRCRPAERRRERESAETDDERAPLPDRIGDAATDEQQAGERERVRGDHPGALGVVEAERTLDRRQRNAHDCCIEHDDELGERDEPERQSPAARITRHDGRRRSSFASTSARTPPGSPTSAR